MFPNKKAAAEYLGSHPSSINNYTKGKCKNHPLGLTIQEIPFTPDQTTLRPGEEQRVVVVEDKAGKKCNVTITNFGRRFNPTVGNYTSNERRNYAQFTVGNSKKKSNIVYHIHKLVAFAFLDVIKCQDEKVREEAKMCKTFKEFNSKFRNRVDHLSHECENIQSLDNLELLVSTKEN